MEVPAVEDVEQRKVEVRPNLTKRDVLSWNEFGKRLGTVVTSDKTLVEDQLRNSQGDRALELSSDRRVVRNRVDRHDTNVDVSERVRVPLDLSLEQVWVVANFSELHDQVHQVLHLLLVFSKLKEVLSRDFLLDAGVQQSLSVGHVTEKLDFLLRRDLLLDVALHSAKHKRLQNRM